MAQLIAVYGLIIIQPLETIALLFTKNLAVLYKQKQSRSTKR